MAHRIFAYGSLTAAGGAPGTLTGWRHAWNVAMDNSADIPGYKHYVLPDGSRPPAFVTFLNIERGAGTVDGIVLEVEDLEQLDARERNYLRVEAEIDGWGTCWTYVGTAAARARFERGRLRRTAVVQRDYVDSIAVAIPAPPVPVIALARVENPVTIRLP